jgi:predicted small secreted protein
LLSRNRQSQARRSKFSGRDPCRLSSMLGWLPDPIETRERIIIMHTKLSVALVLFVLIGAAPLLGACHTTAGAGEDISATGHAITHSADKNTP